MRSASAKMRCPFYTWRNAAEVPDERVEYAALKYFRILPSWGGLPGPAFFPEGFGLYNPTADATWPDVMAVGHNFGCEDYRNEIDAAGREDNKATWRNLCRLLADADVPIESCFMTNWFVGLQPGSKRVGEFLSRPDSRYERECSKLLLEQIRTLKPDVILLLGLPVVGALIESCQLLDLG
jgi:hypothetical protein